MKRLFQLLETKPAADLFSQLDQSFESIGKGCVACHKNNRDRTSPRPSF
jgi:hypothetical protein